jgi:hypothetical protein
VVLSEFLPPGGPTLAWSRLVGLELGIMVASESSCHAGPESTCHIMCQRPGRAGSESRPGPGDWAQARIWAQAWPRWQLLVWGDARLPAGGSPAGPRDSGQGDSLARAELCRRRGSAGGEPKRPRARPRVGRAGGARPACLCVFEMPGGPLARPGRGPGSQ